MLGVEIVDDDQVEIGGRGHLAAAELAERQHARSPGPAMRPCSLAKFSSTARCSARISTSASRANASPACSRRHRAGQDARADQEHLLLARRCGCDRGSPRRCSPARASGRAPAASSASSGSAPKKLGSISASITCGQLREDVGEPRRGAEHQRDQRDQVGILPQQREQPAAAVQAGEKPVERDRAPRPDCRSARNDRAGPARARRAARARTSAFERRDSRPRASRRTSADASSGWRKPISVEPVERLAVVGVGRKRQRPPAGLAPGAFSNSVA